MTAAMYDPQTTNTPAPVKTAAEADALARHFVAVLDKLLGVVQQETELVRAGRLSAAAELTPSKTDLTRLYVADALRLRASQKELAQIAPGMIETLRRRHDEFRALLQTNMTVLATAHAVSEGIIRGVAGELARKAAPQTYAATGRPTAPTAFAAPPISLSRRI